MEERKRSILIQQATNDERDKQEGIFYTHQPPLTLYGERILWYCFNDFYEKLRNGFISYKGHFSVGEILEFLNMSKGCHLLIRRELNSETGIKNNCIQFTSKENSSVKMTMRIFKDIYIKNSILFYEFEENYLKRSVVQMVNRYSVTTEREVTNYTSANSFKLAKWIKDRTSLKLNEENISLEDEKKAAAIRKQIEDLSLDEAKIYINSFSENIDVSKVASKERLIDKVLGIKKKKNKLTFTLNEMRKLFYGEEKANWKYYDLIIDNNNQDIYRYKTNNFLNKIVKKALKQVNEFSLFNVSLPVNQIETGDIFDKEIQIVVDEKTGLFGNEEWRYVLEVSNNLKIALINGIQKTDAPQLLDGEYLSYDDRTHKIVKNVKNLSNFNDKETIWEIGNLKNKDSQAALLKSDTFAKHDDIFAQHDVHEEKDNDSDPANIDLSKIHF